jgi:hypothetical protein
MNIFYIVASPLFTLLLGDDPLSPDMIIKRKQAVTDLVMHGLLPTQTGRSDDQARGSLA